MNSGRRAGYAPTRLDRMRAVLYGSRRLPPSGTGPPWLRSGSVCGGCVVGTRLASTHATPSAQLQALRETGATGLEPATFGVTGREDADEGRRRSIRDGAGSHTAC